MVSESEPLLQLLRALHQRRYVFVAITPATHARVLSRGIAGPPTLRDIFGWNRTFTAADLDPRLLALLDAADALEIADGRLRSKVRVGSVGGSLFLHSSYPTEQSDSVFLGPDTYRFIAFVRRQMTLRGAHPSVVDMGAGAGVGGILVARSAPGSRVTLVDINPSALKLARINAAFAGAQLETVMGDTMPQGADLVIANPPYMIDASKRAYRDGGELLGGGVALDWVRQALASMAPGGTMLLYTGAAYEQGRAPLLEALQEACTRKRARLVIDELDPDVFGEELDNSAYATVERIAVVGAIITKAAAG